MSGPLFFSAAASGRLSHPALGSLFSGMKIFQNNPVRI